MTKADGDDTHAVAIGAECDDTVYKRMKPIYLRL